MNLGTWNVQGLSTKTNEVLIELKQLNMDIVVLTETKKKGQGSENLGHYDHFYSGISKDKRAQQGVSILVRKSLRKYITSWEAISQRIIKMNVSLAGNKTTIIGTYGVNDDDSAINKDNYFEQLSFEISKVGTSRELIILGDINARTGKKVHDKIVGRFGEEITNDNGARLISVCQQNQLKILNGFFQHKMIHKFTWIQHTRNLKSIIDYVITRQQTKMKIQDVKVQRGATCGSDHYLLKTKMLPFISVHKGDREGIDKYQEIEDIKYNVESLQQESVRELFKRRLDEKLKETNFDNTEQHYSHIKNSLAAAAEEAIGRYENTKRPKTYWWDKEIEDLIIDKKEKYSRFLNSKSECDKKKFKESQAKVRKTITKKKNETWERTCTRINTYLGGNRNTESWKTLKSLRQDRSKDIISPITLETWDKYFSKLLTESRPEFQNHKNNNINIITSPIRITIKDVKEVCMSLKNRKSPGPGSIPPELIKNGTEKLFSSLKTLFQKCINGEPLPEEWKTSYISTIHKKGSRDNCDNYRGIAVLCTVSRIYGKLIKNKIEQEYCNMEAEEQAGFRAGRSTVDHLFSITQIIDKKTARNQELHMLYVDLRKAYDSVPQQKLWESLETTNINASLIKAVTRLYENSTSKIKMGRSVSQGFLTNKGLKQGCCLSPTLFKIYLETALANWKRKCKNMGIPLGESTVYTLCFADDQIILAQEYEDLEYMTRKLIEEYKNWGLDVNLSKTEYMCIGGQQQNMQMEDGQQIKHSTKYKYLGMFITDDGRLDEAIAHRNNQGRIAIRQLNSVLWDKKISKINKRRIYNSIIKSITTYSSEVWPLKEKTIKMLEATEMDYWRRAAGISRLDKVRNTRIREIMKIEHTITEDIRINQLRWYGHVQRMSDERLPKQILNWTPHGRRKRGRPRLSWREGIDKAIEERGLEENLWEDRDRWKLGIGRRRRTF